MFAQGTFVNDANATPEQIARKREMIRAMMPKYGSAKYVGEGLGQLFYGIGSGRQENALDRQETAGRKSAEEMFASLVGKGSTAPGSFGVLGAAPMEGASSSSAPMPPPDPNSPHALGNDAMAALGKPAMTTAATPEAIKAGLVARGLPDHVAEGFVMNFQDESGLNPGINEISPLVPGSRGGFGLYQLTGPRRRAYEAYATERGVPVDDVDAQLDFMMTELQGSEANAAGAILSTKTPGEAGAAIVNEFLRPSPEYAASRASEYLAGGGTGAQPGAPAPAGANGASPSIPTDQLLAAMSNPWLSEQERSVLASIYDQQVQAGDPMRQLELQKAQMEVEAMRNPAAPKPIQIGDKLVDPVTFEVIGDYSEPEPGFVQMTPAEVQAAGLPPGPYQRSPKGEIKKIGGDGTSVTVNTGGTGPDLGKLSTDYGYVLDPVTGEAKIDPATGLPVAAPVPGSPAAIEQEKIAQAGVNAGGADIVATETITTAASRARDAAAKRELGGFGAGLAAMNPYSDSAEVERQVDVLRANAATTTLQAMRDASPTGSTGLGALTAPEMKVIQDKAGALNQNSPNFLRDLEDYERTLLRTIHGPEAGDRIYEATRASAPTKPAPAADADAELKRKYGITP